MKITKVTHYRGHDEEETTDFVWFESDNEYEVVKKLKKLCELLKNFEGLEVIATCPEECYVVFAEGLSKNAYWVKVIVTL